LLEPAIDYLGRGAEIGKGQLCKLYFALSSSMMFLAELIQA